MQVNGQVEREKGISYTTRDTLRIHSLSPKLNLAPPTHFFRVIESLTRPFALCTGGYKVRSKGAIKLTTEHLFSLSWFCHCVNGLSALDRPVEPISVQVAVIFLPAENELTEVEAQRARFVYGCLVKKQLNN